MTDVVRDAIAEGIAELERVTETPTGALGYGTDISCERDLDGAMTEVSGLTVLAQALVRRLDCPRGQLPDDPDYGFDLRAALNRGLTDGQVRALAGQVRTELGKDDRLDRVVVTVEPTSTGSALRVDLRVTPVDRRLGPFRLTLAVSSAAVLIEELAAA